MHWLEKFRRRYTKKDGKKGISRAELAAMVKLKHGRCSEKLIEILEEGGITHPNIADQIAKITRATERQRDSMVHDCHRTMPEPPKPKRRAEYKVPPPPVSPGVIPDHARRVVAIDMFGNEVARYESQTAAAAAAGCSTPTVSVRCRRAPTSGKFEFRFFDYTWRFAAEWDAMSPEQRAADIENARRRKKNDGAHDHKQVSETCTANQPG